MFFSFHDGGSYHTETSPLICRANHWTGFYMITASFMKELILKAKFDDDPFISISELFISLFLSPFFYRCLH